MCYTLGVFIDTRVFSRSDPMTYPPLVFSKHIVSTIVSSLAVFTLLAVLAGRANAQEPLSERLVSADESVRRSAFRELDGLDIPSRMKYLEIVENTLRFADPSGKQIAAESLGRMGSAAEEAVPDLVQALGDEQGALRSAAAAALSAIGPSAVPALVAALEQQDPMVRRSASDALGGIGPRATDAIPGLLNLLGDRDYEVGRRAATALGHIGPVAVPALLQAAAKGDSRVTAMAETVFAYLDAPPNVVFDLVRTLGNITEDPGVRVFAANALGRMGEKARNAVPDLVRALGDERREVRSAASLALGRIGRPAVPAILEAIKGNSASSRAGAASALGSMGTDAEDVISALIRALKDQDAIVRVEAISALEKSKTTTRPVASALIQVLNEDKDDIVRIDAARVLNKIGTAEAKAAVSRFYEQKPASQ